MTVPMLSVAARCLAALVLTAGLSACGQTPPAPDVINDPWEGANRAIHNFNKAFDQAVARPAARTYIRLPRPVTRSVTRFSVNLETPGRVINSVLQGRVDDAAHNTLRFALNSTLGIAGLFDPATEFGLVDLDTDFGETMFVWGVPEGPYVEVPFFGPYTTRGAVGFVVDFFNSPILNSIDTVRGRNTRYLVYILDQLETRAEFDTFFNDIYSSADSYAQARTLYLQNRRFELGRGAGADYFDPYGDTAGGAEASGAGSAADDLYFDPYEDAYAE